MCRSDKPSEPEERITLKRSTLTTVGRPIDLSYPTNRAIAIASLLVMLGATGFQRAAGTDWMRSIFRGTQVGLSLFLAWALCRELDPDHDLAAFVAAGFCLGGLLLWGLPRLAVIFWLILVMRVVNRTMGAPAGLLDALALLALGVWLSVQDNWGYGVIMSVAFLLDGQLARPALRQLGFSACGLTGTAAVALIGADPPWGPIYSPLAVFIALGISVMFLPVIAEARTLSSRGDASGEPLVPARVRSAQFIALLVGVHSAFLRGLPALGALVPLWAAFLGAAVYWLWRAM